MELANRVICKRLASCGLFGVFCWSPQKVQNLFTRSMHQLANKLDDNYTELVLQGDLGMGDAKPYSMLFVAC